MATSGVTNIGKIKTAIDFLNNHQDDTYIEFAKDKPWDNEKIPDGFDPSTTDLPSLAFKKATNLQLVYDGGNLTTSNENTENTITYKGRQWIVTDSDHALELNAHFVLVTATLDVSELSSFEFRQIGIRLGTQAANNVSSISFLANQVLNKGTLIAYENLRVMNYQNNNKFVIKYLLEF